MNSTYYTSRKISGFTIVELLIVIVVLGILASITIVSYAGIRERAVETAVKSDLRNGSSQIEISRTLNGQYPDEDDTDDYQWSPSTTQTYLVNDSNTEYCLQVASATNSSTVYKISSESGAIEEGACAPFTVAVLDAPVSLFAGQGPSSIYVDWTWPATLTAGTYDVYADIHCVGSYAFITQLSQTDVSATPGGFSPTLSVPRATITSACANPIRFTVYYTDPSTNTTSPTTTVNITP